MSEEEDIYTANDEDEVINYLINNGVVRFRGWTLTPETIDDWSIDYLDDIYELPFTDDDMRSFYNIYAAIGVHHKPNEEEEEDDNDKDDDAKLSAQSDDFLEEEEEVEEQQQQVKQPKKKIDKRKLFKDYSQKYDSVLRYPFKSKVRYFDKSIQSIQEPIVHDYKLKNAKKLCKPNFSRTRFCWEIDVLFAKRFTNDGENYQREQTIYLTLLNVNTRYLKVLPVKNREIDSYIDAIKKWLGRTLVDKGKYIITKGPRGGVYRTKRPINERFINNSRVQTLKGDGEFDTNDFKQFCNDYHIKLIVDDSPYTLHNKSVDSVMRTLRNAFGLNDNRIADNELMQQMVNYYNNTPHRSLKFPNRNPNTPRSGVELRNTPNKWIYYTPRQVHYNAELEWEYIRMMNSKLLSIKKQQEFKGLLNYKTGNIILVHLDKGKTIKSFEKRRRVFDDIAEFKCYRNGNVICRLLKPYSELIKYVNDNNYHKNEFVREPSKNPYVIPKDYISVPIVYTKYVCKDYESIPDDYKKYFDLV